MNKNKIRMSAIVMMAVIFVQSTSVYAAGTHVDFGYNSPHEDGAASQKDGIVTIGFNEVNDHEASATGENGGGKGSGGTTPSTSVGTTTTVKPGASGASGSSGETPKTQGTPKPTQKPKPTVAPTPTPIPIENFVDVTGMNWRQKKEVEKLVEANVPLDPMDPATPPTNEVPSQPSSERDPQLDHQELLELADSVAYGIYLIGKEDYDSEVTETSAPTSDWSNFSVKQYEWVIEHLEIATVQDFEKTTSTAKVDFVPLHTGKYLATMKVYGTWTYGHYKDIPAVDAVMEPDPDNPGKEIEITPAKAASKDSVKDGEYDDYDTSQTKTLRFVITVDDIGKPVSLPKKDLPDVKPVDELVE